MHPETGNKSLCRTFSYTEQYTVVHTFLSFPPAQWIWITTFYFNILQEDLMFTEHEPINGAEVFISS